MKRLKKWWRKIRIGFLHAAYHRNLKYAERAMDAMDINTFKKHIYRAEDLWKKIVILSEKK